MTPNSLSPAFVQIEYSSEFGLHIQTIPTRAYTANADPTLAGTFPRWSDNAARAADDMIEDLIAVMKAQMPAEVTYSRYTIFTQADADDPAIPRFAKNIAVVGTGVSPGYSQAVQLTISAQAADFSLAKLILLDSGSFDDFDKITAPGVSTTIDNIFNEWSSTLNAWASRLGGRPMIFRQAAKTLNEKLRREYRQN